MLRKSLIALVLIPFQSSFSQTNQGTVIYELKMDLYRRIPAENVQMRAMVPQYRTSKFELVYADNRTIFKAKEEEQDIADQPTGGGGIVIRTGSQDDIAYRDLTKHEVTEVREFMGTNYLIQGPIKWQAWKLEDGNKKILGFNCKKASTKNANNLDVTAWYTEEIPFKAGPQQYGGLPGLILSTDTNNGELVFTAIAIDKKADLKLIKAPSKGKSISSAEFAKMQKEALESNGGMRIVTK